jgi:hypothetical protein
MRVIVCGSRDWEGIWATERINKIMLAVDILARALGSKLEVIHGGCPTGADAIVDRWARRRDVPVKVWEADWGAYGKAAGPLRNSAMALGGADLCIGFLKDNSQGTIDMTEKAKHRKIPTFIVDWEQEE